MERNEFFRELNMLKFPKTPERLWRDAEALADRCGVQLHSNAEWGCQGNGFNSPDLNRLRREVLGETD